MPQELRGPSPSILADRERDECLDVPSVLEEGLLLGSVWHACDLQVLRHLHVSYVLDAENPRKRAQRLAVVGAEADPEPFVTDPTLESGRIELDDDDTYESFKAAVLKASELITTARSAHQTVFVCCTHGNNESVVVCVVYYLVAQHWTLERAFNFVRLRRPAAAPRRAYIEKLQRLEEETRGQVTLRSTQVGPSMMDLMRGLQGERASGDGAGDLEGEDAGSQTTEGESGSALDRASFLSNFSFSSASVLHSGTAAGGMLTADAIVEKDEEGEEAPSGPKTRTRTRSGRHAAKDKDNAKAKESTCTIC